jgi:hypothetical protein
MARSRDQRADAGAGVGFEKDPEPKRSIDADAAGGPMGHFMILSFSPKMDR